MVRISTQRPQAHCDIYELLQLEEASPCDFRLLLCLVRMEIPQELSFACTLETGREKIWNKISNLRKSLVPTQGAGHLCRT